MNLLLRRFLSRIGTNNLTGDHSCCAAAKQVPSVCDLCNADLQKGNFRQLSSDEMKTAVHSGFAPARCGISVGSTNYERLMASYGLSPDMMDDEWRRKSLSDMTTWTICGDCLSKITPFLKTEAWTFDPSPLMNEHFDRMTTTWPREPAYDWARGILRRIQCNEMPQITALAAEKLRESLSDEQRHSVATWKDDLCIWISILPCSIQDAPRLYYPEGYMTFLDRSVAIARCENPRCHWIHLQFLKDKSQFWFQFTLFPCRDALSFSPLYQLPIDLLTDEEKKKVGLK